MCRFKYFRGEECADVPLLISSKGPDSKGRAEGLRRSAGLQSFIVNLMEE